MVFVIFLLAVILVVVNAIPVLSLAQAKGFKLKPTGFAYFIGAIGNLIAGNIVPISAQAETISLAGLIKNVNERIGALFIAAVFGIIFGLSGGTTAIVNLAGPSAIDGMIGGVGIILSMVAIDLMKSERRTGIVSIISALITWSICNTFRISNALIWTIAASVVLSTSDFFVIQKQRIDHAIIPDDARESEEFRFWKKEYWQDFKLLKPKFSIPAALSGLSLFCLNVGSNISFGNIASSLAGTEPHLNALTVISGLVDIPSVLFGGTPIKAIISGTAAAPWPLMAGVVMMLMCAFLLLTGVIGRLGKYIPPASISGFLLVIGLFVTFVPNLNSVMNSGNPMAGVVALGVTALTKNAFIGIVVGSIVQATGGLLGLI